MSSHNKGFFGEDWTIIGRDPGDEDDQGAMNTPADVIGQMERESAEEAATYIAAEAHDVVEERGKDYGSPSENHRCTARMWSSYLERRYGWSPKLDAEDVCWLNVLQKISRQAHVRKRDNKVDVIGFVINADMLEEK